MNDLNLTVSFTGHRNFRLSEASCLERTLELLYRQGKRRFMSGMAVGFDLAAAEAVLALRQKYEDVKLVAVVPFEGHDARFSTQDQARFARICRVADRVEVLSKGYAPEVYALRNDFLVDHAQTLVAWYDGSAGGTAYTVRRALRLNRRLIHLHPRTPLDAYPEPSLF